MKVHLKHDYEGEWCQMWVDGKLRFEDHHEREAWWHVIAKELGVEITKEECNLEE